jgi:hypothetical protein
MMYTKGDIFILIDKEAPQLLHLRVTKKDIKDSVAARNVKKVLRNGKPYRGDPND